MRNFKKRFFILSAFFGVAGVTSLFFTNCAKSSFEAAMGAGDPLLEYAWHIKNTGQKVFATNAAVAGIDLNLAQTWTSGISGRGVKILISDDGIEDTHQDLSSNYLYSGVSKDYSKNFPFIANTAAPSDKDDNHGTAVAGLAAAAGNNGYGSKGVAFGAWIVSANFLAEAARQDEVTLNDQITGDFDVFNLSWGSRQNGIGTAVSSFHDTLKSGALSGRNGKGATYVKAAGNFFYITCANDSTKTCLGNSNFDTDNNGPFTMMVGAMNSSGDIASYSSPGSNLWISAFGGEFGDDYPAMLTTDRSGCSVGFSTSTTAGSGNLAMFERGGPGNSGCTYTASFNGTSSAAPVMSGVVALLLQANPNLSWRDIRYILAKTAKQPYADMTAMMTHPLGENVPGGMAWEYGWIQNSAGFKFHNWFGFGQADVDAAVSMAKNFVSPFGAFVETDYSSNSRSVSIPISDNTAVTDTMTVAQNIKIESVQLRVSVSHADVAQIGIELTSPSEKKNYLVNFNNALRGVSGYSNAVFLTNAFYQERANGIWTIKVIDAKTGTTGSLTGWSLRFTGSY